MSRRKEIAKFFCGVEAFRAFVHTYFWLSGTTPTVFGVIAQTPAVHMWGALANATISVVLGIYAWRPFGRRSRVPS